MDARFLMTCNLPHIKPVKLKNKHMNYEVMSLQHTLDIKQAPYDQHSQKKLDPAAKPEAERDRQTISVLLVCYRG